MVAAVAKLRGPGRRVDPAAARSGSGSSLQPPRREKTTTQRANAHSREEGKGSVRRVVSVLGIGEKDLETCSSYATS